MVPEGPAFSGVGNTCGRRAAGPGDGVRAARIAAGACAARRRGGGDPQSPVGFARPGEGRADAGHFCVEGEAANRDRARGCAAGKSRLRARPAGERPRAIREEGRDSRRLLLAGPAAVPDRVVRRGDRVAARVRPRYAGVDRIGRGHRDPRGQARRRGSHAAGFPQRGRCDHRCRARRAAGGGFSGKRIASRPGLNDSILPGSICRIRGRRPDPRRGQAQPVFRPAPGVVGAGVGDRVCLQQRRRKRAVRRAGGRF